MGENPNKPLWSHRVSVSKERNINVTVWPPGEGAKYPTPSIVLDEGRKGDDGTWTHDKVKYIPQSKALEVAEAIRMAWRVCREGPATE